MVIPDIAFNPSTAILLLMLLRLYAFTASLALAGLLTACAPSAPAAPTVIPFPTTTPGRAIEGVLPTVIALPLDGAPLANPATAVALASRPTATPDSGACPASAAPELPPRPTTAREMEAALLGYLTAGGSPEALVTVLRDDWQVLTDANAARVDADFTGEGVPDVLLALLTPDEGGTLLLAGCVNGVYAPLYESLTGATPPQIIQAGDFNFDGRADVLFATPVCSGDPESCSYRTQLVGWRADAGRIVSLMNAALATTNLPSATDIDNDRVLEIVVRLTDEGDADSGPLRTGVNIYDWNGTAYVLSIVQLDPPRFLIQVVQEADRALNRMDAEQAISLYNLSLTDNSLRAWQNDDSITLRSYAYYRLLLAYAYTEDDRLLAAYQASQSAFPDPAAAPVYASLVSTFWNAWQVTNNLHSACVEVAAAVAARPEAVGLLNRYGTRGAIVTAPDVCPF